MVLVLNLSEFPVLAAGCPKWMIKVTGPQPWSFSSLWPWVEHGLILFSVIPAEGKSHTHILTWDESLTCVPDHASTALLDWTSSDCVFVSWCCPLFPSYPLTPNQIVSSLQEEERLRPLTQTFVHRRHSIPVGFKFQWRIRWFGKQREVRKEKKKACVSRQRKKKSMKRILDCASEKLTFWLGFGIKGMADPGQANWPLWG